MWAFAEGNEVMYFVILFYLLLPFIFWIAGRSAALIAHSGDS
jgi:cbb3-type cytochrome oxidase subunit 3